MLELFDNGWMSGARRAPSPNFGPRPEGVAPDLLVVHCISLPPGEFGGPCIEQFFCNCLDWDTHPYFQEIRGMTVSSHFLVRRGGEVVQFVSCDDRAWHAGESSYRGRDNCNDFSIGVELEGTDEGLFERAQYVALGALANALFAAYPAMQPDRVAAHSDIAPGRKSDPGPGFDWQALRSELAS